LFSLSNFSFSFDKTSSFSTNFADFSLFISSSLFFIILTVFYHNNRGIYNTISCFFDNFRIFFKSNITVFFLFSMFFFFIFFKFDEIITKFSSFFCSISLLKTHVFPDFINKNYFLKGLKIRFFFIWIIDFL